MSQTQVFMAEIGAWMRDQRAELHLCQAEVAQALGVSVSTVSGYERGEVMMSTFSHAALKSYFRREHVNRGIPAAAKVTA